MTDAHRHVRFQRQPAPVLPEHRPLYKIAQILLVLHIGSRAGKSSLPRLHLFNWALKAPERIDRLSQAAKTRTLNVPAWGFDPALAIALRYASAELLITNSGASYQLADLGQLFAKSVIAEPDVLFAEKEALAAIGKSITEAMVDAVAKGWEAK